MKNSIVSTRGLPCGTCQGYGDVEARVWHLQSVIAPVLGIFLILFVLGTILIIATSSPVHHSAILTLLGTLGGSVVGFYFKGAHSLPKAPQTARISKTPQSKLLPPVE